MVVADAPLDFRTSTSCPSDRVTRTWSGSEIFAFGLQQYSRAMIVGERTRARRERRRGRAFGRRAVAVNVTKITGRTRDVNTSA